MANITQAFGTGFNVGTAFREGRENAHIKAQNRQIELARAGYSFENGELAVVPDSEADIQQKQNEITSARLNAVTGQLAAMQSDRGLEDFAHNGDAGQLQKVLNNNPALKTAWGDLGIQSVDNINWDMDGILLTNAGFQESMYNTPEKRQELGKSFFKTFNGKNWQINALNNAVKTTGITDRLGTQRAQVFTSNFETARNIVKESLVRDQQTEEFVLDVAASEASAKQGLGPEIIARKERAAQQKAATKISESDKDRKSREWIAQIRARTARRGRFQRSAEIEIGLVKKAMDELFAMFGGSDDFYRTDFTEPQNFRRAARRVEIIENLAKSRFTNDEKKELKNISEALALSNPISKLTEAQTGFLDSLYTDVKKFFVNDLTGVAETAAFEQFKIAARNIKFGATLSENEKRSWDRAHGTLRQKLGPVLQQYKISLDTIAARFESLARLKNPLVVQVRLGGVKENLNKIRASLQERLDYISNKGVDISAPLPTTAPEQSRESLEDIFQ